MRLRRQPTIQDDRGACLLKTRWTYEGQHPFPWDDVFHLTPAPWRWLQWIGYAIIIPYVASIVVVLVMPPGPLRDIAQALDDVFPYVMLPWALTYGILHFVSFRPWLKRYQSAQGRCQACDYDLTSLSADPDGCTTCPECGAAWRLTPNPDA